MTLGEAYPKKIPHEPGFPILRVMFFFLVCPQDCCSDVFCWKSHTKKRMISTTSHIEGLLVAFADHTQGPLNFNHPPLKSQNTNCKQLKVDLKRLYTFYTLPIPYCKTTVPLSPFRIIDSALSTGCRTDLLRARGSSQFPFPAD